MSSVRLTLNSVEINVFFPGSLVLWTSRQEEFLHTEPFI